MKVIVGILLIVLIATIVILLLLVSYLLWDEVCDTYQKNRKRAIATKRLEDEMKRVCDEPQMDGTIDEARFKAHCMNCQRDVADIKCLDCDGDKYFIAAEPQTEREGE